MTDYVYRHTTIINMFSLLIVFYFSNLIGMLRMEWVKNAIESNIPLYVVLVFVLSTTIILPLASLATLEVGYRHLYYFIVQVTACVQG